MLGAFANKEQKQTNKRKADEGQRRVDDKRSKQGATMEAAKRQISELDDSLKSLQDRCGLLIDEVVKLVGDRSNNSPFVLALTKLCLLEPNTEVLTSSMLHGLSQAFCV